jgi:hypothetical protein
MGLSGFLVVEIDYLRNTIILKIILNRYIEHIDIIFYFKNYFISS